VTLTSGAIKLHKSPVNENSERKEKKKKCSIFVTGDRVTRLGKFLPIVELFTFGIFLKLHTYVEAQILKLFSTVKVMY
jgi:hypothetical protein